jgi:hypothetical protein
MSKIPINSTPSCKRLSAPQHTTYRRVIGAISRSLRERIFPMLKPINLLVFVRERNLPMLVYRPFLADLMITYVVDEARSVAYINEQHLERWGVASVRFMNWRCAICGDAPMSRRHTQ